MEKTSIKDPAKLTHLLSDLQLALNGLGNLVSIGLISLEINPVTSALGLALQGLLSIFSIINGISELNKL